MICVNNSENNNNVPMGPNNQSVPNTTVGNPINNSIPASNSVPNTQTTTGIVPPTPVVPTTPQQVPTPAPTVNTTPSQSVVNPNIQPTTQNTQVQPQVVGQVQTVSSPPPEQQVVYTQSPPPPQQVAPPQAAIRNTNLQPPKKKPSAFRYFLLVLFFLGLGALVWFLPDIRSFMMEQETEEKRELIHGTMRCVYEEEDAEATTTYTSEFLVDNNKLKKYTSIVETKGNSGSEEELNNLNEKCETLTTMVKKVPGIESDCSLHSRKQISRQTIDYAKVNTDNLESAYSEAGGIVPDYHLDDDAIEIKREMSLARYSCTVS